MARTTLTFDSVTPAQVYNLTLAFQRTLGFTLPEQITKQPTVTVGGSAMGWASPALRPEHAVALLAEYARLEHGVFDDSHRDTAVLGSLPDGEVFPPSGPGRRGYNAAGMPV